MCVCASTLQHCAWRFSARDSLHAGMTTEMPPPFELPGFLELLKTDPRPTFVVRLSTDDDSNATPATHPGVTYKNQALANNGTLSDALDAIPNDESHAPFWHWVLDPTPGQESQPCVTGQHSLSYIGIHWTKNVVRRTWVVMSGNDVPPSSEPPRKVRIEARKDGGLGDRIQHAASEPIQSIDFAARAERDLDMRPAPVSRSDTDPGIMVPDFMPDPEPFLDVIQSIDWDGHCLGEIDDWPVRLRQAFNQTIPDSRAIAIYWGPEYYAIYNETFSKLCGVHHPRLLGRPVLEIWPDMKEDLDRFRGSSPNKLQKIEGESNFFIETPDGSKEETYVKWSLSPIIENRKCVGIQHCLMDITSMRLWQRRMRMLIDLGDVLVAARDVKSYWTHILEELKRWDPSYDVPLAFVYSVGEDDDTDSSRSRYDCPRTCRLEGALGVPENHPIAPPVLELRDTDKGLAPRFRDALNEQYALLIQTRDETLPEELLEGLEWRGFGDVCQQAVICPLRPTKDENIMGILFLGLNPRRPYDNDYFQFISLLNQKLTSSLASTILLEEEARRGRNAAEQAAYESAQLQKKLAYQTEQANQSLQNFMAVAEFIPTGMSFVDNQGNVTFANDSWYRITGYPQGMMKPGALLECVFEEDKHKIDNAYKKLETQDVVTYEFRVPCEVEPDGDESPPGAFVGLNSKRISRHILASTKAERAEDGSVIRMLTCLTDVTEQKEITEEALRRAQQAENLKRLAEFATVGMYDLSVDGRLLSANNLFWEFTGLQKVDLSHVRIEPWQTCVLEEDLPALWRSLEKSSTKGKPQTAEVRLKTMWQPEDGSHHSLAISRSVTATFMPVRSMDGEIQSFTGCLIDVTLPKWQLGEEKRRKEEAIESKRQQENFIDMTSHEMRNPLSAILHCTDAIIASLSHIEDFDGFLNWPTTPIHQETNMEESKNKDALNVGDEIKKLVKDSIENAETIVTCAQHQKRIVDDILTMSKLDSKLLAVTPCTQDPIKIVESARKMFEVEARRVDILLRTHIDPSYKALGHQYLDIDPSRVQQVLINLLTNALKFTKTGDTRNVDVYLKGSATRPDQNMTTADFIPRFCELSEEYEQPALAGRENPVYLLFEVKDTGQGLTETEMGTLFNKFVQASAKTHVKYGGSGLGLFISRRLTELQHGAIGVSSKPGVGSTFAFYIEAYVPNAESLEKAITVAAAERAVANTDGSADNAGGKRIVLSRDKLLKKHQPGSNLRLDGILVVEDNLINQQITRRGLAEKGYSVEVANHGIEALDKLRKSIMAPVRSPKGKESAHARPGSSSGATTQAVVSPTRATPPSTGQPTPINLVLMDMEMPIQDGLTCTRHIRELEEQGHVFCASGGRVPIIAVTANARPEQINEAREAGCDDVLVKPYRIPELVERMQIIVRRMRGLSPNSPHS